MENATTNGTESSSDFYCIADLENCLNKSEPKGQTPRKYEGHEERIKPGVEGDVKLIKQIHNEREKERKSYLQEIATLEKQNKLHDVARKRQQAIARRLEEIQIEEARQRDEEETKRKRNLIELMYHNGRDFSEPSRPTRPTHCFPRTWNGRDYASWFHLWQVSLEEIYRNAPLHQLARISEQLVEEQLKLRRIVDHRFPMRNYKGHPAEF